MLRNWKFVAPMPQPLGVPVPMLPDCDHFGELSLEFYGGEGVFFLKFQKPKSGFYGYS